MAQLTGAISTKLYMMTTWWISSTPIKSKKTQTKLHVINAEERDAGPYKMFHDLLFLKSEISFVKHISAVTRVTQLLLH